VFLVLSAFAAVYWCVALICVVRVGRHRARARLRHLPPVSILKPLHGDDGQLYDNLESFCRQDYPRYEVLCGVQDAGDPAAAVVHRLAARCGGARVRLITDSRSLGANPKVSNLANILRHARFETLLIADADIRVGPDYLRAVVGPLMDDPRVGLVTCLYVGVPGGGLASRLGAMFINEWFLPSACVGAAIEPLRHAFGVTMVCPRTTLRSVGGFAAFADELADDYRLGRLVSQRRLRVALAPYVVRNVVVEPRLRTLFFHELRWARTIRTVRPVSYAASLLTFGIPTSLLWLTVSSHAAVASVILLGHLAIRCLGRMVIYRSVGQHVSWPDTLLVPLRDVASFMIGILSFAGRTVRWNGSRFRLSAEGYLRPDVGAPASTGFEPVASTVASADRRKSA